MKFLRQHIALVVALVLVALMVWASAYLNSWSHGIIAGSRPDFMRRTLTMVECYADPGCYAATYASGDAALQEEVRAALICASTGPIDWATTFDVKTPQGMSAFIAYLDGLMQTAPAIGIAFEQRSATQGHLSFALGRSQGVEVLIALEERDGHLRIVRMDGLCEALKRVSEWKDGCE